MVTAKKREWTETSEASQEDEGEEGLLPKAKRMAQAAEPIGHLRWVNVT